MTEGQKSTRKELAARRIATLRESLLVQKLEQ